MQARLGCHTRARACAGESSRSCTPTCACAHARVWARTCFGLCPSPFPYWTESSGSSSCLHLYLCPCPCQYPFPNPTPNLNPNPYPYLAHPLTNLETATLTVPVPVASTCACNSVLISDGKLFKWIHSNQRCPINTISNARK